MAVANIVKTYAQGFLRRLDDQAALDAQAIAAQLAEQGRTDLLAQGCAPEAIQLEISLDMRYIGQSFELNVDVPLSSAPWRAAEITQQFHSAHANEYGYSNPSEGVEVVAVRLLATATPAGRPARFGIEPAQAAAVGPQHTAKVEPERFDLLAVGGLVAANRTQLPVVDRLALKPGDVLQGPLVVAEEFATVYVGGGNKVEALNSGALLITVG